MIGGLGGYNSQGKSGVNIPAKPPVTNNTQVNQGVQGKMETKQTPLPGMMTLGTMSGKTGVESNPQKSQAVTDVQGNVAKQVTGNAVPYNRLTLPGGKQIDVNVTMGEGAGNTPMTPEQKEEVNKRFLSQNKEKLTGLLGKNEAALPEGMKNVTVDFTPPSNAFLPVKKPADMNYNPDNKTLNIPFDRLNKKEGEFNSELKDAVDPSVYNQRKKLSDLGIRWSDPNNSLTGKEEVELMKSLEGAASRVSPDKRPKDLPVNITERATMGGAMGTPGYDVEGVYNIKTNDISISRLNGKGEKHSMESLKDTVVHEYGHAVADTNKPDQKAEGYVKPDMMRNITDDKGRNISDRAKALEKEAKAQGHNPDDPGADNTLYDKFDPYVRSHGLKDEKGNITDEKYARTHPDEHYAETFNEYVRHPDRFKGKMNATAEELKKHKEGTPEYNYLKESLDIQHQSYNYFKNNIFGGYEFGKN